jgi:hypothetical protein
MEQLNQKNTTRLKAHSIYQRMGEAPWGCIRKSWPVIVVVTQPPEATVRYEWMERLMHRDVTVDRPDRVLVIGTIEDYMTVGHKVWENQLFARGYDPTSRLVYGEDCGLPTRGARVATLCIQRGSSASSISLPFFFSGGGTTPATISLFCLDGL